MVRLRLLSNCRVVVILLGRLEEQRELVERGDRSLITRHEIACWLVLHDRHVGGRRDDVKFWRLFKLFLVPRGRHLMSTPLRFRLE